MKHLICAVIMLASTALLCAANTIYVSRVVAETSGFIEEAVVCAESNKWNEAQELCSQASEFWSGKNDHLGIVLNHNVSDHISEGLPSLGKLAQWQETGEFTAQAAEMLTYLDHIKEMEMPSLSNIF